MIISVDLLSKRPIKSDSDEDESTAVDATVRTEFFIDSWAKNFPKPSEQPIELESSTQLDDDHSDHSSNNLENDHELKEAKHSRKKEVCLYIFYSTFNQILTI